MAAFKAVATAAVVLSAVVYGGAAKGAESLTGVYLSYNPGISVEYLSLVDSSQDTAVGYLAAVRASRSPSPMQSSTQILSKRIGNTLLFGRYSATRTTDGFVLTSVTRDGGILQERLIRSTVRDVNASILALQESANRTNKQTTQSPGNTSVHAGFVSAHDAIQLSKAQTDIDTAQAQLSDARETANRMVTLAAQARSAADHAMGEPGVSFAQNQSRVQAMKRAGDAELKEVDAEHRLALATAAVASARADVERFRNHVAEVSTSTPAAGQLSANMAGP